MARGLGDVILRWELRLRMDLQEEQSRLHTGVRGGTELMDSLWAGLEVQVTLTEDIHFRL